MNRLHVVALAVLFAAIVLPSIAGAAENAIVLKRPDRNLQMRLRSPEAHGLPTRKAVAPLDAAALKASVDQRMRVLFDRAADPSTKLVTAVSARNAGVGILSDQFADIDRDKDGILRFAEVSDFFDARSAIAKPASPDSSAPVVKPVPTGIQIIE